MTQTNLYSVLKEKNDRGTGLQERPTQCGRILKILMNAGDGWVDGMFFLNLNSPITQYHARIFEIERKYGFKIQSRFVEGKNWKEYRLAL